MSNFLKQSISDYHITNLRDTANIRKKTSWRQMLAAAAVTVTLFWLLDTAVTLRYMPDTRFVDTLIADVPPLILIHRSIISAGILLTFLLVHRCYNSFWLSLALKRSSKWFSTALKSISAALVAVDEKGRVIFMNKRAQQMTGRALQSAIHKRLTEICAVIDAGTQKYLDYGGNLQQVLEHGESFKLPDNLILQAVGGAEYHVAGNITAIKDDDVVGAVMVLHDLSDFKQTQKAMLRFSTLVEQANDGIVMTDKSGQIKYVNQSFIELSGYLEDRLIGSNVSMFAIQTYKENVVDEISELLGDGKSWRGRFELVRPDRSIRKIESAIFPIVDLNQNIINYVSINRDVTNELYLQHQLNHAQRLEAIGRLTSGIAHEFRNILTIIDGFNSIQLLRREKNDPFYNDAVEISKAVESAQSLIQQLLTFSRDEFARPLRLNPNEKIREIESMIRRLIEKNVGLFLNLDPEVGLIEVDPHQFGRAIINLVLNASESVHDYKKEGEVRIITSRFTVDAEVANEDNELSPGEYVRVAIADDGAGIDDDNIAHIFEPFFTTKPSGKGTGLGLSIVYGFVRKCGGDIKVTSKVGEGTRFELLFPVAATVNADLGRVGNRPPDVLSHCIVDETLTILVVEDEDFLRQTVLAVLNRMTCSAIGAADAEEAIRILESHPDGEIDIIITDINMPGMSGIELADRIRNERPEIIVILMSGLLDDKRIADELSKKHYLGIRKPFTAEQFMSTVQVAANVIEKTPKKAFVADLRID